MTAAINVRVARWWDFAAFARESIRTMAHASICTIFVQSGVSIAVCHAAASWWNGTVRPMKTVQTGACASIGCIKVSCCPVRRTMLLDFAGWRCCAIRATETILAMACTTINPEIVNGRAMTTAMCHSVAAQRGMIAEVPTYVGVHGVAPNARLAIRVAAEVVIAKTRILILHWTSGVHMRSLTCPVHALLPIACPCLAASVVASVAGLTVRLVANIPLWLAKFPAHPRVSCVAPNHWLAIRVATKIVLIRRGTAQIMTWIISRSSAVPMWRLVSPPLALSAID